MNEVDNSPDEEKGNNSITLAPSQLKLTSENSQTQTERKSIIKNPGN